MKQLLQDVETHLIDMYRAVNPSANYEIRDGDRYIKGNRTADIDPILIRVREAKAIQNSYIEGEV